MKSLHVINSRGERELFSLRKVYNSARRVGASQVLAEEIARTIEKQVFPGIKTIEIFKKVRRLLSKKARRSALRFSLKEGMRRLGPTGFPFEGYIGEVFKKLGYKVKINQHPQGHCISSHEIDFIASKGNLVYIGECKYRNLPGERIHLKDALANFARYIDILNGPYFSLKQQKSLKIKTMMVTNTKFTSKTKNYSYCMGVELLGWNCPKNKGLEHLIEREKLYPITILPSVKRFLRDAFASEKIMLVEDLARIDPQRLARKLRMSRKHLNLPIKEAKILLGDGN